eukprot:103518_1
MVFYAICISMIVYCIEIVLANHSTAKYDIFPIFVHDGNRTLCAIECTKKETIHELYKVLLKAQYIHTWDRLSVDGITHLCPWNWSYVDSLDTTDLFKIPIINKPYLFQLMLSNLKIDLYSHLQESYNDRNFKKKLITCKRDLQRCTGFCTWNERRILCDSNRNIIGLNFIFRSHTITGTLLLNPLVENIILFAVMDINVAWNELSLNQLKHVTLYYNSITRFLFSYVTMPILTGLEIINNNLKFIDFYGIGNWRTLNHISLIGSMVQEARNIDELARSNVSVTFSFTKKNTNDNQFYIDLEKVSKMHDSIKIRLY